ncbi:MAG: hypothetical protein CMG00_03350 [Candidatus Marinimicrobia bacterium]|nr:hypothetical protein [Candidatus Neomarinimicrobiota bacterium]|tara:strand:- start:2541 stop:3275 length:735 start_codon:yes stop_codon:yes gene_type:complete
MNIKFISILFVSVLLHSNDGIALLTKSKGSVEYKKNSDGSVLDDLKTGQSLFDKDRIKTGSNGFAKYVYLDDGSMIKVHKNAEVYVYGTVDKRSIIKQINVAEGSVKFEVSKQAKDDFTVITPTSVASVKGTDFWLDSDDDEGDQFFGLSGLVNVTNIESGDIMQLTRNTTVTSTPNGAITIKKTEAKDFKKLQDLELGAGEIDDLEYQESLVEQAGENLPEGEIKIQLDDGSGSLKEIIIRYK